MSAAHGVEFPYGTPDLPVLPKLILEPQTQLLGTA